MNNRLAILPVNQITLDRVALRDAVDKKAETWAPFVESVRSQGILNPISVRALNTPTEQGHKYAVVDGMHRYEAALEAGLTEIPTQILDFTGVGDNELPVAIMIRQVTGNINKVDTKPAQYLKQIQRIWAHYEGKITLEELGAMFSRSAQWVSNILGLRHLPQEILSQAADVPASNLYVLGKLAKASPEEITSGNWIARATTTAPEDFAAEATARVKQLTKKARNNPASDEYQAPLVLRSKSEIQEAYVDAHDSIKSYDDEQLKALRETQETAFNLGRFAAFQFCMSQDPETVATKRAEYEARLAEAERRKSENSVAKMAEAAAQRGVSVLAPKGNNRPIGT